MRHLDLFSGIGGFALAASWVWGKDHEIQSFIEIDPFCQKVIKKHWPGVPIHGDIKTYEHDGTKIDLLTGGFPCQPFSVAGKQRGKEDDRALWPEMLRIIKEAKPRWIIGENVAGIVNMELDNYVSDLEAEGYEVQPFIIPACAVDAPHRRDRVWIVAHTGLFRQAQHEIETAGIKQPSQDVPDNENQPNGKHNPESMQGQIQQFGISAGEENVADTECINDDGSRHGASEICGRQSGQAKLSRGEKDVAYTEGSRQLRKNKLEDSPENKRNWRGCNLTTEGFLGRKNRRQQATNCLPEPDVGRVANGVSHRVDRLKSLGNAIVPQCVQPIMEAIKQIEKGYN